jgi:hypothetical protein
VVGVDLFWKKVLRLVAAGWFVLREKYTLMADKPSNGVLPSNPHTLY